MQAQIRTQKRKRKRKSYICTFVCAVADNNSKALISSYDRERKHECVRV